MKTTHPAYQFAKLSDEQLQALSARPGLSPQAAAALALEVEMRRITPAELESYRAQAVAEYAKATLAMRYPMPQSLRARLWQARGIAAVGGATLLADAWWAFASERRSWPDIVIMLILGGSMVLAGVALGSSAKAALSRSASGR